MPQVLQPKCVTSSHEGRAAWGDVNVQFSSSGTGNLPARGAQAGAGRAPSWQGSPTDLFCYAILRGVDGHELRVLGVLISAGRGSTVYHNLENGAKPERD